jgi:hypothetical protein
MWTVHSATARGGASPQFGGICVHLQCPVHTYIKMPPERLERTTKGKHRTYLPILGTALAPRQWHNDFPVKFATPWMAQHILMQQQLLRDQQKLSLPLSSVQAHHIHARGARTFSLVERKGTWTHAAPARANKECNHSGPPSNLPPDTPQNITRWRMAWRNVHQKITRLDKEVSRIRWPGMVRRRIG